MYVLMISEPHDWSTHDVMDWIAFYKGKYILSNANAILHNSLSITISKNDNLRLNYKNQLISFSQIKSCWYRRATPINLFPFLNDNSDNIQFYEGIRKSIADELKYSRDTFFRILNTKKWLNSPWNAVNDKMESLINARKCGLKIPETIITNQKQELSQFLKKYGDVIIKPIYNVSMINYNQKGYLQYTYKLTSAKLKQIEETFIPCLAQKMISKEIELRVFYLNKECYSMAMFTQANPKTVIDFRRYDSKKPSRTVPYNLPLPIKKRIRKFMENMRLNSGSIDLIKDTKGDYYFLEVNPVGQFGMTSYPCNFHLEKRIAQFLSN